MRTAPAWMLMPTPSGLISLTGLEDLDVEAGAMQAHGRDEAADARRRRSRSSWLQGSRLRPWNMSAAW